VPAADLVLALDVLGTATFAFNGAFTASRAVRLDIVGVLTLGMLTAIGGGLVRDVLIGAIPPAAFTHWYYIAVAGGAALVAFFISRPPRALRTPMLVLDAVGLSLFCVVGAQKALAHGLDPAPAVILGAVTAVGGGTLRDVLIGQVPTVLTSGLYAIPALAGATVAVAALRSEVFGIPVASLAAAVCFVIRMIGVRYNLNAPTPPRRRGGDMA
jgi:uncharacterized membrane protein YeiH